MCVCVCVSLFLLYMALILCFLIHHFNCDEIECTSPLNTYANRWNVAINYNNQLLHNVEAHVARKHS